MRLMLLHLTRVVLPGSLFASGSPTPLVAKPELIWNR